MHRFLIIIEKAKKNYSAFAPDLPGCIATGSTRAQVEKNMMEAVEFHVQGLKEDHKRIPASSSFAEYIAVPA